MHEGISDKDHAVAIHHAVSAQRGGREMTFGMRREAFDALDYETGNHVRDAWRRR